MLENLFIYWSLWYQLTLSFSQGQTRSCGGGNFLCWHDAKGLVGRDVFTMPCNLSLPVVGEQRYYSVHSCLGNICSEMYCLIASQSQPSLAGRAQDEPWEINAGRESSIYESTLGLCMLSGMLIPLLKYDHWNPS